MGFAKNVLMLAVKWLASMATSVLVGLLLLFKRLREGPAFFHVKPRPSPPPLLYDSKWGKHAYMDIKSQGVRLHYVEAGDRSKPLMVLVHGFPECWFSWRHQLTHFAKTHWVVAVDMRGYGDSDKPTKTSQYRTPLLLEDLRLFIQALGREKCTLVAHDWGAVVAWLLVVFHPEMFSCHVSLNGPHMPAFQKHLRQSWTQKFKSWYIFFFQMPWLPEMMCTSKDIEFFNKLFKINKEFDPSPDEVNEAYKYYFSQKDAFTFPLNYYRNITFDSPELPKVKVPTLVVWGTEDNALDKDIAILNANECERAKVKFVEGASHFLQQEQPQAVNKHIQNFLEELPGTN